MTPVSYAEPSLASGDGDRGRKLALRAEAAHEQGRTGVFAAKTWLESTTYLSLGLDAYRFAPGCTVTCLDDSKQTFDLRGQIYERHHELFVEVKTYTVVGGQKKAYDDFLAIAYSATAKQMEDVGDPKAEFMWVTTYPFDQGKWLSLTSRERIKKALERDQSGILGGRALDEELLTTMSDRIWLLVLNERQHELTLTPSELSSVESVLQRKTK